MLLAFQFWPLVSVVELQQATGNLVTELTVAVRHQFDTSLLALFLNDFQPWLGLSTRVTSCVYCEMSSVKHNVGWKMIKTSGDACSLQQRTLDMQLH